ncbi:MAG TPA: 50S ribosomal protein L11 methyltransferase [Burkholderiales bacterium]|nr:50S ribosomal protein L11 methyltransferase [Burkholderiales bacterium]
MAWRALVVEVDAAAADAFSDALLAHGAASATIEDACAGTPEEQPVFDELNAGMAGSWARARIRALVATDADAGKVLAAAAQDAGLQAAPRYAVEEIGEADWVRAAQHQFEPIRISERLWIVPSWHAAPDAQAININLDPGLAFGTGSHPTTQLCLQWLERHVLPVSSVLDYGCGSGILAIAAMKLGARAAVGVDVDPAAVAAARENAARNGIAARFIGTDVPVALAADLVVANILANPLVVLAPVLAARCRAGGRVALGGILAPQADAVVAAYATWFEMTRFATNDGWVCLEGVRR